MTTTSSPTSSTIRLPKTVWVYSLGFLIFYLTCFASFLWQRPYMAHYLQGDANYNVNITHNISQHFSPESTFWAIPKVPESYKNRPLTGIRTDYSASLIHWSKGWYVSGVLVPLLYSIFPEPPMHVFAIVILSIVLGYVTVMLGMRRYTGSTFWALVAAHTYVLSPWLVHMVTDRGYWDLIGYGLAPWFFFAFVNRQWRQFVLAGALTAGISVPIAMYTAIACAVIAVFSRTIRPALWVILASAAVVISARVLIPFCTEYPMPEHPPFHWITDNWNTLFSNLTQMDAYFPRISYDLVWFIGIPAAIATVLLFAVDRWRAWRPLSALLIIAGLGFLLIMSRHGIHRNFFLVTPAFIAVMICAYHLSMKFRHQALQGITAAILATVLISHTFMNFDGRLYGPKVISYALGIKDPPQHELEFTAQMHETVDDIFSKVPQAASMTTDLPMEIEAVFANRRYSWFEGWEPESSEFLLTRKQRHDPHLIEIGVYTQPITLYLYRNTKGSPYQRNDNILGWSPVRRALGF